MKPHRRVTKCRFFHFLWFICVIFSRTGAVCLFLRRRGFCHAGVVELTTQTDKYILHRRVNNNTDKTAQTPISPHFYGFSVLFSAAPARVDRFYAGGTNNHAGVVTLTTQKDKIYYTGGVKSNTDKTTQTHTKQLL